LYLCGFVYNSNIKNYIFKKLKKGQKTAQQSWAALGILGSFWEFSFFLGILKIKILFLNWAVREFWAVFKIRT
jgi:hypothetical protein